MTKATRYLILFGAILLNGCQSQAESAADLVILKRSQVCPTDEAVLREVRDKEEFQRLTATGPLSQDPPSIPDVDLSRHAIMLLAMGEQPSTGYRIDLDISRIRKEGGTLWLPVEFHAPTSEVVATMITSPCVIFSVKRDGLDKVVAGNTGLTFQF
jgi:hypothetical protein